MISVFNTYLKIAFELAYLETNHDILLLVTVLQAKLWNVGKILTGRRGGIVCTYNYRDDQSRYYFNIKKSSKVAQIHCTAKMHEY